MKPAPASRQRGVTLIVGLIMLILITLMVTTAFTLNMSNLKSVGNMQFRNESIAAANKAIEQFIATNFTTGFVSVPAATTITFDINNDANIDYRIGVFQPTCVEAMTVTTSINTALCGGQRAGALAGCPLPNWSTLWDLQARVQDVATGSTVTVRQGMRIEITDTQRNAVCPAT